MISEEVLDQDLVLVTTEAALRRQGCTSCIAHNNVGNCHLAYKCGSVEHFMVNCPKVYSASEVAAANANLSHHCGYCGKKEKLEKFKQCSGCKSTRYCSEKCQRYHWVNHKPLCNYIQDLSQYQKVGIKGKGDSSDPDA